MNDPHVENLIDENRYLVLKTEDISALTVEQQVALGDATAAIAYHRAATNRDAYPKYIVTREGTQEYNYAKQAIENRIRREGS